MAKFYAVTLPSTHASPETMYFFQQPTLLLLNILLYNSTEKKGTLSAAASIFQVKSTHTKAGPCEMLSLWHIRLMSMGE